MGGADQDGGALEDQIKGLQQSQGQQLYQAVFTTHLVETGFGGNSETGSQAGSCFTSVTIS
jgi:hypothetical protein